MKIGLIVGSLRKDSWNRKVAETVQGLFPEGVEVEFIDIANVPFYNEDIDFAEGPNEYRQVRDEIAKYDAYIFFTPEYNRSYTPAIKNIVDVVSHGHHGNIWSGKPAAVFSASMGSMGGMAANHALRQSFIFVNMHPMQQPEVYLGHIQSLFNECGEMLEDTKDFLADVIVKFIDHVEMINSK